MKLIVNSLLIGMLLGSLAGAPATAQVSAPIPYVPGLSFGPFGPISDNLTDQAYIQYAAAYWQWIDSGMANPLALDAFNFQHPNLLPYNSPTAIPVDVDPFGRGRVVFEELYSHRLSMSFGFEDLIFTDPLVSLAWRHWTYTHQVVTAPFVDPQAHQKHINALIDAFTVADGYVTRGVPYYDGTILVSDRTKKKKRIVAQPVPNPVNVTTLPQKIQDVHASICANVMMLSGFPGLYMADGGVNMVGFDCDDFADAIGSKIVRCSPEAGTSYTNKYVSWTTSGGADVAHLVTKISFCGYFWLVDAQTGMKIGPFADGTVIDASPLIMGGYDVRADSSIDTSQKCYAPGDRGDWKGEPPPWYTDPAKVMHFEDTTGLDADDFVPPGVTPAMPPATGN